MGKRTIKLTVENEYVRGAGVPVGAAGSHDEVELVVTFVGDVWIGTNKYVTFRDALGQSPRLKMLLDSESVIELSEDGDGATIQKHKITVPYAAKTHAGNMSVTFTGYTVLSTLDEGGNPVFYEGECINTMTAFFRVLPSDYVVLEDGSLDGIPGATLAQQCQSAANSAFEAKEAAEAAKEAAIEAKEVAVEEAADIRSIDWNSENDIPSDPESNIEGVRAIQNKPEIYRGDGAGSVISPECKAYGRKSVALGTESHAGINGYYIGGIDLTNNAIYLSKTVNETGAGNLSYMQNFETGYMIPKERVERDDGTIEDVVSNVEFVLVVYFSRKERKHLHMLNTISEIDGNKITFRDSLCLDLSNVKYESGLSPYFYIPSQPYPSDSSIAFGGDYAHAEGKESIAAGDSAHAEGFGTIAAGNHSHTEGVDTYAAWGSHAEGAHNKAMGNYSHAEGLRTYTERDSSHAEGQDTKALGGVSHAEGNVTTAEGNFSHSEGYLTNAKGIASHAEGQSTVASGSMSHAEGNSSQSIGIGSHAEGNGTIAEGKYSHTEGTTTYAKGAYSHAEGAGEGNKYGAMEDYSHSEGYKTIASGIQGAHAEGYLTIASNKDAHAEGSYTTASGPHSHAEGDHTEASANFAHAEGQFTKATNSYAHAEGSYTTASGEASHAAGIGTIASGYAQTVVGTYNAKDPDALFIVGNGTSDSDSNRKNAFVVKKDGSVYVNGVKVWPNT